MYSQGVETYKETLLARQLPTTLPLVTVVVSVFVYFHVDLTVNPRAAHGDVELERWYCSGASSPVSNELKIYITGFTGIVLGAALQSLLVQTVELMGSLLPSAMGWNRIASSSLLQCHKNRVSALSLSTGLSTINTLAQALSHRRGGLVLCEDGFGLRTMLFQWTEWLTTVPLMLYMIFTLDSSKTSLSNLELAGIVSITFSILFGFMSSWDISNARRGESGWFLSPVFLILSVGTMAFVYYVLFDVYERNLRDDKHLCLQKGSGEFEYELDDVIVRTRKQQRYGIVYLVVILTFFPATFFLGWIGYLEQEVFLCVISFLGFLAKHLLVRYFGSYHIEMVDPAVHLIKREKVSANYRRDFLRYVFHEVRVPLNSISMGLTMLHMSEDIKSVEDAETLSMMDNAVGFMSETLNDVLSMQKIEEGKLELQYSECNIITIAEKVYLTLRGQFHAKKLVWRFQKPADDVGPVVLADRFKLEHVLANLIGNAVKFSPQGGKITLKISRSSLSPDRFDENGNRISTITWSIFDEGPGIKPEDQAKLFKTYTQIEAHLVQQGQGTGVGLTICKEIVEMHGGSIGVRSPSPLMPPSQFKGSQFYITIPVVVKPGVVRASLSSTMADTDNASSSSSRSSPTATFAPASLSTEPRKTGADPYPESAAHPSFNVLVVDDVHTNRLMLGRLLKKKNLIVELAEDGDIAVSMIQSKPAGHFQIVFMDNQMPKLCGIDAIRALRANQCNSFIIGLTGELSSGNLLILARAA